MTLHRDCHGDVSGKSIPCDVMQYSLVPVLNQLPRQWLHTFQCCVKHPRTSFVLFSRRDLQMHHEASHISSMCSAPASGGAVGWGT